ncbi:hypothetical protein ACOSP7_001581 [Xanthoceras sorbifolium]
MTDNHPICVLKVNLQGCQIRPEKVNEELQKINGVFATNIDTTEGLVTVAGLVDPTLLIETIKKLGIQTHLLAYEKNPSRDRNKHHFLKNMQRGKESPSKGKKNNRDKIRYQSAYPLGDNYDSAGGDHHNATDDAHYMGPHGSSWHHPRCGRKSTSGGARSRPSYVHGWYPMYHDPMPNTRYQKSTRPPLPHPFDIYGQGQEPEVGNAPHHLFSDENVRACHIM